MDTSKAQWRTIVVSSLGVFFLFSTMGFAFDVMQLGQQPVLRLVLSVFLFGVFAICYATAGFWLRREWWKMALAITVTLIVQNGVMTFLYRLIASLPRPAQMGTLDIARMQERLKISAIASITAMVLAYICFLYVTITEGRRHIRVRTEVELASEVHRTLVPTVDARFFDFEFYGRSLPSGEVGGDLIDVFQDHRGWIAYVADVSGHGVAPGVVMAMVKSAARMRLSSTEGSVRLLESLNFVLCSVTRPEMFVTFAYLASHRGRLECSTAGHPAILHYHSATKEISEIASSNMPLGMFDQQSFATDSVACAPNDMFLLLTDGLLELADSTGQEFGIAGVKTVVSNHGSEPLKAIFTALMDAAKKHGGNATDDQSLLLVRAHTGMSDPAR